MEALRISGGADAGIAEDFNGSDEPNSDGDAIGEDDFDVDEGEEAVVPPPLDPRKPYNEMVSVERRKRFASASNR